MIWYSTTTANTQSTTALSVVQVMSYDDIYGLHPVIRWWGSASVIDDQWLLLTNNHVVSDENGNPMSAFAICRTVSISSRPDCSYTASLIARDSIKDVALLRINPKTINNTTTDYNFFPKATLGYDYTPTAQDSVVAIGYPWIGIDTITQTVGVVAGTQEVNDQTYIKTDVLIEWGNSGGPLVKDNMIVGVNTFTYWRGGSLAYAISVSEIKDFIATNKDKTPQISILSPTKFQESLATNELINKTKKLSDQVFDISFSRPYVITHYIANNQVAGRLQVPSDIHVSDFYFNLKSVPYSLDTEDSLLYALKQEYWYNPSRHKIIKKTISGISMLRMVSKEDPTNGDNDWYQFYIWKYNNNTLVELTFWSPSIADETKIDQAKKNRNDFLNNISIKQWYKQKQWSYTLVRPAISVNVSSGTVVNIVDSMNNIWRQRGWSIPFVYHTIDKPYNTMKLVLSKNLVRQGKKVSVDKIYETTLQSIPSTHKKKFTFKWNEGYVYCKESTQSNYLSPSWATTKLGECIADIYLGTQRDYILTVQLWVKESDLISYQKKFFTVLQELITIESIGDGTTKLPESIITKIQDITKNNTVINKQSKYFKNLMNTIINKKVIKVTWLDRLDQPTNYIDAAMLYIKIAFNEDPMKYKEIFQKASINGNMYIWSNNQDIERLKLVIDSELAWAKLPGYDRDILEKVVKNEDGVYNDIKEKIQQYYYSKFWQRRMTLTEWIPESNEYYGDYDQWENGFSMSAINMLKDSEGSSYNITYKPSVIYRYDPLYVWLSSEPTNLPSGSQWFHSKQVSGRGPVAITNTPLCGLSKSTTNNFCRFVNTENAKILNKENKLRWKYTLLETYAVPTLWETISQYLGILDTGLFDPEVEAKRNMIDNEEDTTTNINN